MALRCTLDGGPEPLSKRAELGVVLLKYIWNSAKSKSNVKRILALIKRGLYFLLQYSHQKIFLSENIKNHLVDTNGDFDVRLKILFLSGTYHAAIHLVNSWNEMISINILAKIIIILIKYFTDVYDL